VKRQYRVAQWATGNVGLQALRSLIAHPQFELVGVKTYSDAKAGRDAGELCGLDPVGVKVTKDVEAILAARPDCVVYMPDRPEIDVLCRLLEGGINVVTSLTDFNHRDSIEPTTRARLESACARGDSSLYASGSTPGYSTETVLFALTSIMRRIDRITQTECADLSSRNSPEMLFDLLGFGRDPDLIGQAATIDPTTGLAPSLRMTAAALGLPLDGVTCHFDYAVSTSDFEVAAGKIRAGTIAAIRMEIQGVREGRPLIVRRAIWYLTQDIEPRWTLPESGWHYKIEGDVPMDVKITHPVSAADYPSMTPGMTAHPVINAIPYVCEARAGLLQTNELPPIIGNFSPF
jgi:hypothetical protein